MAVSNHVPEYHQGGPPSEEEEAAAAEAKKEWDFKKGAGIPSTPLVGACGHVDCCTLGPRVWHQCLNVSHPTVSSVAQTIGLKQYHVSWFVAVHMGKLVGGGERGFLQAVPFQRPPFGAPTKLPLVLFWWWAWWGLGREKCPAVCHAAPYCTSAVEPAELNNSNPPPPPPAGQRV